MDQDIQSKDTGIDSKYYAVARSFNEAAALFRDGGKGPAAIWVHTPETVEISRKLRELNTKDTIAWGDVIGRLRHRAQEKRLCQLFAKAVYRIKGAASSKGNINYTQVDRLFGEDDAPHIDPGNVFLAYPEGAAPTEVSSLGTSFQSQFAPVNKAISPTEKKTAKTRMIQWGRLHDDPENSGPENPGLAPFSPFPLGGILVMKTQKDAAGQEKGVIHAVPEKAGARRLLIARTFDK